MANEHHTELQIEFEPDYDIEQELDDEEPIQPELITDTDIGKCRVIATVACVEYGKVGEEKGAFLIFSFNFHNSETQFRGARITARFTGAVVKGIAPEISTHDIEEVKVNKVVGGTLTLGAGPTSVGVMNTRTTESARLHRLQIHGSGVSTPRAVWTLEEENAEAGNHRGIPGLFSAEMVVQAEKGFSVRVGITATLGRWPRGLEILKGIRKVKNIRCPELQFDGETELGRKPSTVSMREGTFVKGNQV